ncbi:MAG: bifunctional precorrin-2 dehydrogenase/sirohydrochlorin ferrochelatase [Desulfobacterales bacterium]|nr:bifunctional precorrin-2 dehydrogenase/sirohydrochlorin ferrochelatase [Desulfobacterales bacterium]
MKTYYPIFLDVEGKTCLVVGGGAVGTRKALGLARANAKVRVVSPEFSSDLTVSTNKNISLEEKTFEPSDLENVCMVFATTDSFELNAQIRDAARSKNILCNIASGTDKGDFILPSVVERDGLLLAVSTCGASPALAKQLRRELEDRFGPEYGVLVTLLGNIRKKILAQDHDPEGHKQKFNALLKHNLTGLIATNNTKDIDIILSNLFGDGFSFNDLTASHYSQEL